LIHVKVEPEMLPDEAVEPDWVTEMPLNEAVQPDWVMTPPDQ
jgi:hypothetical protein